MVLPGLDNGLLSPGVVSVEPSLSLDDHVVILELGISKPRLGDSASGDSVVDGDKGVKLVPLGLVIRTGR